MNVLMLLANTPSWDDDLCLDYLGSELQARAARMSSEFLGRVVARRPEAAQTGAVCVWTPSCTTAADSARERPSETRLLVGTSQSDALEVSCRGSDAAMDASAVAALLEKRLARLHAWSYRLADLARARTANLQEMLNAGSELIPCALVLFDGGFNYVGHTGNDEERSRAMAQTIERGYSMGVSAEHQREYRQLDRENPQGFATLFVEGPTTTPVWARSIGRDPQTAYHLHAMGDRSVDEGTRALFGELAGWLFVAVERVMATSGQEQRRNLVEELVTKPHEEAEARQRAWVFGWEDTEAYRVIRIESRLESVPTQRWANLARRIETTLPFAHTAVLGFGLAVLLCDAGPGHAGAWDALGRLLASEQLVAGVSDPRANLGEANRAYREACVAVAHADEARTAQGRAETACRMIAYDSCKVDLLVEAARSASHELRLLPNALRTLEEHDAQFDSAYLQTATAFLSNLCVKARTCEALHIHRATLDYRLERIEQICGVDLLDAAQARPLLLHTLLTGQRGD